MIYNDSFWLFKIRFYTGNKLCLGLRHKHFIFKPQQKGMVTKQTHCFKIAMQNHVRQTLTEALGSFMQLRSRSQCGIHKHDKWHDLSHNCKYPLGFPNSYLKGFVVFLNNLDNLTKLYILFVWSKYQIWNILRAKHTYKYKRSSSPP